MSLLVLRQDNAKIGDLAFDNVLNEQIELVDQIKTKSRSDSYWIAKDQNNKLILVNERDLIEIGYYS